ncbi:MAG: NAD(P)-dependent oxidoreductase [Gemmatimonadaceae bacterium]
MNAPADELQLEEYLSRPDQATCSALGALDGDVLILGAGGKMGPTLARLARRALDDIGASRTGPNARRVIAVSRFGSATAAAQLESHGVEVTRADLSDPAAYASLPRAHNVVWMVGQKFGTTGDPVGTWTHNVAAATFAAEHCAGSRVVCFSSGNVYARGPLSRGGSMESDTLVPDGEYAASCIGRERVFESAARRLDFPLLLYRLFYACDLRYGVVTDIALKVLRGEHISLATPAANVIWQGDANRLALRSLTVAQAPALALNVTGAIVSVREIASRVAEHLKCDVQFVAAAPEAPPPDVLLANTSRLQEALPYDAMSLDTLCTWAGDWVQAGNHVLSKPTKFDVRDGKY